jgi:hypothetical protein
VGIQIRSQGPKVSFWGKNLKILNPTLFANVSRRSGNPLEGHMTLYANQLDPDLLEQLVESLPLLAKMPPPGSVEEHNVMNKALLDDATRLAKVIADKDAAIARLEEYNSVRGLLPSDENVRLLTAQLDATEWSSAGVDAAVKALTGRLEYYKAPPPPQPKPLSDGSQPLPLGTTPQRHHTIAQLRDLDQRERAGRRRQAGTFASKF